MRPKEKEDDKKEKLEQSKPVISRPETKEACEQCELLKPGVHFNFFAFSVDFKNFRFRKFQ